MSFVVEDMNTWTLSARQAESATTASFSAIATTTECSGNRSA